MPRKPARRSRSCFDHSPTVVLCRQPDFDGMSGHFACHFPRQPSFFLTEPLHAAQTAVLDDRTRRKQSP